MSENRDPTNSSVSNSGAINVQYQECVNLKTEKVAIRQGAKTIMNEEFENQECGGVQ